MYESVAIELKMFSTFSMTQDNQQCLDWFTCQWQSSTMNCMHAQDM